MHAKQFGNLGELNVAANLIDQGYYVFKELGDICKSDLIVMQEDYKPIKVQVKARHLKNGQVSIKSSKSGPNYRFEYESKHADIYAIYIIDTGDIAYISSNELLAVKQLTIRVVDSKNNQKLGVNWLSNYSSFERALRDYTHNT